MLLDMPIIKNMEWRAEDLVKPSQISLSINHLFISVFIFLSVNKMLYFSTVDSVKWKRVFIIPII